MNDDVFITGILQKGPEHYAKAMKPEITLKIVLETPPAGIDFGIQKGGGSKYETVQKQRSANKDLEFECTVTVKPGKDNSPDFFGPFVQGTAGERFIYIDIGTCAGQENTGWSRRLKIPLRGITQGMIKELLDSVHNILETKVPGTGKDGGPACATVKPFDGWRLSRGKVINSL